MYLTSEKCSPRVSGSPSLNTEKVCVVRLTVAIGEAALRAEDLGKVKSSWRTERESKVSIMSSIQAFEMFDKAHYRVGGFAGLQRGVSRSVRA
jgi:hypothetical protein